MSVVQFSDKSLLADYCEEDFDVEAEFDDVGEECFDIIPIKFDEIVGYLKMFFCDRKKINDSIITLGDILNERNIEMVSKFDLIGCIDMFYDILPFVGITDFSQKIKLFFELQKDAYEKGIPKEYSGGLLLVWLRVCHDLDI